MIHGSTGPGLDQRVVIFPRLPPPSSHSMQSLDPERTRPAPRQSLYPLASSAAPSPSRAAHSFPRPVPARSLSVAPALAGSLVPTRPSVRKRFGVPGRTSWGISLAPWPLVPKKRSREAHAATSSCEDHRAAAFPSVKRYDRPLGIQPGRSARGA